MTKFRAKILTELANRKAKSIKQEKFLAACRTNFAKFNEFCFNVLNPSTKPFFGWHIDYLAEHCEAVILGQIKNLVVNVPPREWKSGMFSIALPAYVLGRSPSEKIACASYTSTLAIDLSVKCRRILEHNDYQVMFPNTIIQKDQNEKSKYETTTHGMRIAVSVAGSMTGFGGNYLLIDDPHDPRRVNSAKELQAAIDWRREVWTSRANNPDDVRHILVMQRLGVKDMTGYMQENYPDATFVVLPRVAQQKTIVVFPLSKQEVTREVGDILNKERFSTEYVQAMPLQFGEYGYAAQQQQQPIPRGGDRIKEDWFPVYTTLSESYEKVVLSYDTASKAAEINNPSGCLAFGKVGAKWRIIDYWLERKTYPDLLRAVVVHAEKHKPHQIIIEDKSTGTSIQQAFGDSKLGLPALPITMFDPTGKGDKVGRMDNVTSFLEAGYVELPSATLGLPWLAKLKRDLFAFPNCEHWEPIDCLSQFLYLNFRDKLASLTYNFSVSSAVKSRGGM